MTRITKKKIAESLASQAKMFAKRYKYGHIKLSHVDKDYFELSDSEIISKFDQWEHLVFWLKGYLTFAKEIDFKFGVQQ